MFCGFQQMKTTTHPHDREGGREGMGRKEKNKKKKEGIKEGEVIDVPVYLPENRNSTLSTASQRLFSLSVFLFLLLFRSIFCPLQIMERVCALTPTLFETKEEITALICAYFAFFELPIPKLYTSPHVLLNYSSTCEKVLDSNMFRESEQ